MTQGKGVVESYTSASHDKALDAVLTGEAHDNGESGGVTTAQPASATNARNGSADEEEATKTSGPPHERVFFHIFLCLVTCYFCMILTSWGKTNGAPIGDGSDGTGTESMWLKILSQWIFLALYCKILHVAYHNNQIES